MYIQLFYIMEEIYHIQKGNVSCVRIYVCLVLLDLQLIAINIITCSITWTLRSTIYNLLYWIQGIVLITHNNVLFFHIFLWLQIISSWHLSNILNDECTVKHSGTILFSISPIVLWVDSVTRCFSSYYFLVACILFEIDCMLIYKTKFDIYKALVNLTLFWITMTKLYILDPWWYKSFKFSPYLWIVLIRKII